MCEPVRRGTCLLWRFAHTLHSLEPLHRERQMPKMPKPTSKPTSKPTLKPRPKMAGLHGMVFYGRRGLTGSTNACV